MFRRFYDWRFVSAVSISLLIVITICRPKIKNLPAHAEYKYATAKIDGYETENTNVKEVTNNIDGTTVDLEEEKQIIEVETNITSGKSATTIITVTEKLSMVRSVTNQVRQIVSLTSVRMENDINGTIDKEDKLSPSDETVLLPSTLAKLREKLQCHDRGFESQVTQRGQFWVYINYIRAEHGPIACHENITMTCHSDFTFLDNLGPSIQRWNGPLSVAIHTPGDDLAPALDSIRYMRDCSESSSLIKKWVTFHLFFHQNHMPKVVPHNDDVLSTPYNCSLPEPYIVNASTTYTALNSVFYPVNVGRNIARAAALTHFIFPLDIELYPSPHLGVRFLNMIAREPPELAGTDPRVFPLATFEVEKDQQVPLKKNDLLAMLKTGKAITFHKNVCPACHNMPNSTEWMNQNDTGQLGVFTVSKRSGPYADWEPFFIGTLAEPVFDERLTWQGRSNKMTQNYIMCVQNYDYMVLNNGFLVHRPGVKAYKRDHVRDSETRKTNALLRETIIPEYDIIYGTREGCQVRWLQKLGVFTVSKRTGPYAIWEPFFIGTLAEPVFEERLTWQDKKDKMAQNYIMCVQDYNFMVLNNAFLVHRPGVKVKKYDHITGEKTKALIWKTIVPEYNIIYGTREGCKL